MEESFAKEGEMALLVFAYEISRTEVLLSVFESRGHAHGLVYQSTRAWKVTGSGWILPLITH